MDTEIGQSVTFHTVDGPRAAIVAAHGKDGDNDTFLVVFAAPGDDSNGTGLTAVTNQRWSHQDHQAGGFSI